MNYFWRKNLGSVIFGVIIAVAPILVTLYQMNDYEYSPANVKTTSQQTVITVGEDGAAHFAESKVRDMTYHVSEQYLYYAADDDDPAAAGHTPQFVPAAFSASVLDANHQLLLTHIGPGATSYDNGAYYFAYADRYGNSSTDETGNYYYSEESDMVKWMFYNENTWGNDVTFIQNYTVNGVALQYNDTAEFFWSVAYTDYVKTSDVSVSIILPTTTLEVTDVKPYIYGSNLARITSIAKNDDDHIQINIYARQLYPGEFITARIDFPQTALTIADPQYGQIIDAEHLANVQTYEAYNQGVMAKYRLANVLAVIFGAIILVAAMLGIHDIYVKFDKEPKSSFDGEYYRELPAEYGPAMMGYLYDFKAVSKATVTATLMDLVRRKFISIDSGTESLTASNANYTMKIDRTRPTGELKPHERFLLKWFFDIIGAGADTISLNQIDHFAASSEANALRYEQANRTWVSLTRDAGERMGFFDNVKAAASKGGWLIALLWISGILSLLLGFSGTGLWTRYAGGVLTGLALIVSVYFSTIERRSIKGNEDFVRWRAFKKFLSEFSNIKDYPMPGIIVWEHYMVYAIQFGIADLVEKQLRFKYRELGLETELDSPSSTYLRYRGFYGLYAYHYMNSMTMARTVIQQAQAARAQANNSGRGGGHFGGGGGFGGHIGGGGGGGHFR